MYFYIHLSTIIWKVDWKLFMLMKDHLGKKGKIILTISVTILLDIVPVVLIMFGIWVIKYFSRFFGFEETTFIKLLTTCSETFMIVLYLFFVGATLVQSYKLFMSEEL